MRPILKTGSGLISSEAVQYQLAGVDKIRAARSSGAGDWNCNP
ncbi:MAG: hypothetical protein WAN14_22615 [Candidatus Acidiferrales bacterium]